jgi:cytochrome c peroxidase
MPIQDSLEMHVTLPVVAQRLKDHAGYDRAFHQLYGTSATPEKIGEVLAAFVKTLETGNTAFDRWMNDGPDPMSDAAVRGREVFMDKGKCFDCHFSPDFTGDEFRNVGLYTGKGRFADSGRFEVTKDSTDLGKFKVPGLRNVAVTGPYMHNGMFRTLDEVIDFYDQPDKFVSESINRDTLVRPLNLTSQEKSDLKAFLEALTDQRFLK